jgi:hypothetical protein
MRPGCQENPKPGNCPDGGRDKYDALHKRQGLKNEPVGQQLLSFGTGLKFLVTDGPRQSSLPQSVAQNSDSRFQKAPLIGSDILNVVPLRSALV